MHRTGLLLVVIAAVACEAAPLPHTAPPALPPPPAAAATPAPPPAPELARAAVAFEQSLVVNLAGEEVGTMTAVDRTDSAGGFVLERTADLTIRRGETVSRLVTRTAVKLDADGAPRSYRFEKEDPGGALVVDAVVSADRKTLELTSKQNGAVVKNAIALPPGFTFAVALEHEVKGAPKDGLRVERPVVLEELGAVVPMTTTVKKDGEDFVITASFQGLTTEERIDAKGRTIVSRTPSVGLVAYPWGKVPADLEAALKDGKKADLLAVSTWKTTPVPREARRVVYRVRTPDAATFAVPEDNRQRVVARTATHVDIEVTSAPSTTKPLAGEARARALMSTPYEAVSDPRIQRAAKDATKGATSDDDKVRKLSAFVYEHVQKKGLDRGYAPAIATLESRAGDCTEHSVLLSALLRAVGLPTRIVDGVVVDNTSAGYHEWVEVDLGKGFVAVDPTFNAWPAGPQRVKLAEGSTLPDEHLGLSLAAARLLKHGVIFEVLSVDQ